MAEFIRLEGIHGSGYQLWNTNTIRRLECKDEECSGNVQVPYPSKHEQYKNFHVSRQHDPVTYENLNRLYNRSKHYDAQMPTSSSNTVLGALAAGLTVGVAATAIGLKK